MAKPLIDLHANPVHETVAFPREREKPGQMTCGEFGRAQRNVIFAADVGGARDVAVGESDAVGVDAGALRRQHDRKRDDEQQRDFAVL